MCGRYYSLFDKQQVAKHFHVRRTLRALFPTFKQESVNLIAKPADTRSSAFSPRQQLARGRVLAIAGLTTTFTSDPLRRSKLFYC